MKIYKSYYDSPIGIIEISANDNAILSIQFTKEKTLISEQCEMIQNCTSQLDEYFEGNRKDFSLPLESQGTAFEKEIWNALTEIPFGKTLSYSDIANKMQNPNAVRAVGSANSKNKILIVLPCHRVIGQGGKLVGYAGELWRKKWLLAHEAKFSGGGEQLLMPI